MGMFWEFADSQQLIDAIASGIVPAKIIHAPVKFATSPDGPLWIEPDVSIPRELARRLREMEILSRRRTPAADWQDASAWWEILRPCREVETSWMDCNQPMILQVPAGEELSRTMREILRLGGKLLKGAMPHASRQSAFLQVRDLPSFSLLAAMDGSPHRVYREHLPRLWIEAGYSHPLAEQIVVAEGRLILLDGSGRPIWLEKSAFRAISEDHAFPIRLETSVPFAEPKCEPITLPLRLVRSRSTPSAGLWLVRWQVFQTWIQEAGQPLCEQLAVAVIPRPDSPQVLVRPLKETAAPVVVWNALGLAPSRALPGLYLPVGCELHPAARPEALRTVLEDSRERLTWITAEEPTGFQVHSVALSAFRPLTDWVDYRLDRPAESWRPWSPEFSWEAEPFEVLEDDHERKPKPQRKETQRKRQAETSSRERKRNQPPRADRTKATRPKPAREFGRGEVDQPATRRRLAELEREILDSPLPVDAPGHHSAWLEMAELHFLLGDSEEGLSCLSHAIWEQSLPDAEWLETMWRRSMPGSLTVLEDWQLVQKLRPSGEKLSHFALGLVWQSAALDEAPALHEHLAELQNFLKRFENDLPVRSAWLAWSALARIASGDALTLARTRDRFLERLFQRGIRLERDFPRFLKNRTSLPRTFSHGQTGLGAFRPLLHDWSRSNSKTIKNQSAAYLDLILAFGLARQGHAAQAQELSETGREILQRTKDPLHEWCLAAYAHRISKAIEGHDLTGPLPQELLDSLEKFSKRDRFKLDRLREASQILEPGRSQDSFLLYHQSFADELQRELGRLPEIRDSLALAEEFHRIKAGGTSPEDHHRIALAGLELVPRMGLKPALALLEQSAELCTKDLDPAARIQLLEHSLRVAAHFDLSDRVPALIAELRQVLESLPQETLLALDTSISLSFQGLRRFGLREEVIQLLDPLEDLAHQWERGLQTRSDSKPADLVKLQTLLLQIAGGRFVFEQPSTAWPVLDRVRSLILSETLSELGRTQVAQAYLRALGFAPPAEAGERFWELFEKSRGIRDAFSTSSHFFLSQLSLAEALVFALAGDVNQADPSTRRLLDEEEYRVRKRIHRDLRELMG